MILRIAKGSRELEEFFPRLEGYAYITYKPYERLDWYGSATSPKSRGSII